MLKKIKSSKNYGYVMLGLLCIGIALPNFCQYQMTSLATRLMAQMNFDESAYSSIATAPLLTGIFLGFISGMLVDRFGTKVLLASIGLTALGVCLRAVSDSYGMMYISMILMGFGASFVNSATPKIMGAWFSPTKITVMMGIVLGSANAAMALGSGTAPMFSDTKGAFIFAAVAAIIVAALWCIFICDKKNEVGETEPSVPFKESFIVTIKNKGVWVCALCGFSIIVGATGCSIFIPQALMSRGMSEQTAGVMSMALTFGNMATGLLTPLLIRKIGTTKKRFRLMMLVYALLTVVLIVFSWRAPEGLHLVICLFACGFFVMGFEALILSFPVYLKGIGRRYSATATGFVLTMQLVGGVVVPTYIAAPIAGSNYTLLYCIFALSALLFAAVSQLLPLDDYFDRK